MKKIKRHFKKMGRLDKQREALEKRIEDEIGYWVSLRYDRLNDVYDIHMSCYDGLLRMMQELNFNGKIEYTKTQAELYPHKYETWGKIGDYRVCLFTVTEEEHVQ